MSFNSIIDYIRRDIADDSEAIAVGIVKRNMHTEYITTVKDPVYPAMTFTTTTTPSIRQAGIRKGYLYISFYTKEPKDVEPVILYLAKKFEWGYNATTDDGTIIYGCYQEDNKANTPISYDKNFNHWEAMIELVIEFG